MTHKITINTKPIFGKQYSFKVYKIEDDIEIFVCGGNDTKDGIIKELNYYLNKEN